MSTRITVRIMEKKLLAKLWMNWVSSADRPVEPGNDGPGDLPVEVGLR